MTQREGTSAWSNLWVDLPVAPTEVKDKAVAKHMALNVRNWRRLQQRLDMLQGTQTGTPQYVASSGNGTDKASGLIGNGTTTTFTINTGLTAYKYFRVTIFDVSTGNEEQVGPTMTGVAGQFTVTFYAAPAHNGKRWCAQGLA